MAHTGSVCAESAARIGKYFSIFVLRMLYRSEYMRNCHRPWLTTLLRHTPSRSAQCGHVALYLTSSLKVISVCCWYLSRKLRVTGVSSVPSCFFLMARSVTTPEMHQMVCASQSHRHQSLQIRRRRLKTPQHWRDVTQSHTFGDWFSHGECSRTMPMSRMRFDSMLSL